MAVQPFQLPLDSLFSSFTDPSARVADADEASPRRFAGRGRTVIAVAAASVFFGGAGSLYMHASMGHMTAMPGTMAAPAATSAGTAAMPAMPGTAPATVQADAAPPRPLGDGMPMPATAAPAAAAPVEKSPLASAPGPSPMTASSRISSGEAVSEEAAPSTSTRKSSSTRAKARRYVVREGDSFGTVAARSGVSESRIAALNPGVDSTSLTIGDSLRVR